MKSAFADLQAVSQEAMKTEEELEPRLNQALGRYGNVHSLEDVLILFINALHFRISSVADRHKEFHRRVTYLYVVYLSQL